MNGKPAPYLFKISGVTVAKLNIAKTKTIK